MPKINKKKMVVRVQPRRKVKKVSELHAEMLTPPISGSAIVTRSKIPPQITLKGSSTFIRNTEYVINVTVAALGAFAVARYGLIPATASWLPGVASNYSKWRWHFLKFIYIPIIPTTTTGQVILSLGYDSLDASATTLVQAAQAYNAVAAPVWAGYNGTNDLNKYSPIRSVGSVSVLVDSTRLGGPSGDAFYRYLSLTAYGALGATDQNVYSPGYLTVATAGGAAANTVGFLFMEYVIELIEPIASALNV